MRKFMITGILGASLAFGACGGGGGGQATKDDLVKAVTDSLTKKDKKAFTALYATIDNAKSACPAMEPMIASMEGKLKATVDKAGTSFDECAKLDWSKAKIVETTGGDLKDAEKECPDVREVRDIKILAEVDGKKFSVKLDDPIQLKGKFFLFEDFECEEQAAKAPEPEPAVADAKPPEPEAKPAEPAAAPTEPAAAPTEPAAAPADPAAAPADPAAAAPAAGTSECDKFVAAYEACLTKLPEAARSGAESGLKQMKEMFAKVPDKAMLESTCKQSYDSVKQAMSSLCPDAFK